MSKQAKSKIILQEFLKKKKKKGEESKSEWRIKMRQRALNTKTETLEHEL